MKCITGQDLPVPNLQVEITTPPHDTFCDLGVTAPQKELLSVSQSTLDHTPPSRAGGSLGQGWPLALLSRILTDVPDTCLPSPPQHLVWGPRHLATALLLSMPVLRTTI